MTAGRERVVYDCNIYLQALLNRLGPAGRCVAMAIEERVGLFYSMRVWEELREVSSRPRVRRARPQLTEVRVEALIREVEGHATRVDEVPEQFTYERDPDDAHYVNLALVARASYVVSRDNDLLVLSDSGSAEGAEFRRRYPDVRVIDPVELLGIVNPELG